MRVSVQPIMERLMRDGALDLAAVAAIVGVAPSTLARWIDERLAPTGDELRRLSALDEAVRRLTDHYDPEAVATWLRRPHDMLGGERAADLIAADRGAAVLHVVDALEEAAFT